jgi:hypothetical protein
MWVEKHPHVSVKRTILVNISAIYRSKKYDLCIVYLSYPLDQTNTMFISHWFTLHFQCMSIVCPLYVHCISIVFPLYSHEKLDLSYVKRASTPARFLAGFGLRTLQLGFGGLAHARHLATRGESPISWMGREVTEE